MADIPLAYKDFIQAAAKAETERMLSTCTEKQRAFFHKLHANSGGWEACVGENVGNSYELVRRTVIKNAKATDA